MLIMYGSPVSKVCLADYHIFSNMYHRYKSDFEDTKSASIVMRHIGNSFTSLMYCFVFCAYCRALLHPGYMPLFFNNHYNLNTYNTLICINLLVLDYFVCIISLNKCVFTVFLDFVSVCLKHMLIVYGSPVSKVCLVDFHNHSNVYHRYKSDFTGCKEC